MEDKVIAILGGGLAGLAVAKRLADEGGPRSEGGPRNEGKTPVVVVEKESFVGGASRTVQVGPYRFDLGGHRFYTKKDNVQKFVEAVVGDELIWVKRTSRILLNGKLVSYPLSPFNALKALGPFKSVKVLWHYFLMKIGRATAKEGTFEQWAVERFGRGLYDIYFKPYSEKVWGIPCDELSADFAEQRIKGLSFREVIMQALFPKKEAAASLITRFCYPRYGFGRITDKMAESLKPPHRLLTQARLTRIQHDGKEIQSFSVQTGDTVSTIGVSQMVSSIPPDAFLAALSPPAPAEVVEACSRLKYRDLIIVFLGLLRNQVTTDTWMYLPDSGIPFGRMHEPANWSRDLSPEGKTSLVVEWFTTKGDSIWRMADQDLGDQTVSGLARLGFIRPEEVELRHVVRVERAYPLYTLGYAADRSTVLRYLSRFKNLNLTGRNGLFLYTSSDHYLDRSLKIAENFLGASHDLTGIGLEAGYAEK